MPQPFLTVVVPPKVDTVRDLARQLVQDADDAAAEFAGYRHRLRRLTIARRGVSAIARVTGDVVGFLLSHPYVAENHEYVLTAYHNDAAAHANEFTFEHVDAVGYKVCDHPLFVRRLRCSAVVRIALGCFCFLFLVAGEDGRAPGTASRQCNWQLSDAFDTLG